MKISKSIRLFGGELTLLAIIRYVPNVIVPKQVAKTMVKEGWEFSLISGIKAVRKIVPWEIPQAKLWVEAFKCELEEEYNKLVK